MISKPKPALLLALAISFAGTFLSPQLNPYHLDIVIGIGINIILAVSLNLINGHTGQFSLGHAGFMAVGAYTAAIVSERLGPSVVPALSKAVQVAHLPESLAPQLFFIVPLLLGGVLAAVAGLLVGAPSLRLKGDYLAIVTLGFGEIIRVILQNTEAVGGARGFTDVPRYTNFFWTFGLAAITVYVITCLVNSTYGRGFIAVHDDEIAAEAMGINSTRYKITAFVTGAFFAGVAGGLYGHFKQYLNPEGFGFMRSIEIVVMVILGGMGNTAGVIAAAVILTILPEVLRPVAEYRMILYSLLVIVLMLTRPQGLFAWKRKTKPVLSA